MRIEFAYEPIVFTRTGAPVAYEQLARLPGGTDAKWLRHLRPDQRNQLDGEAFGAAKRATAQFRRPIFVNVFPESFLRVAELVSTEKHLAIEASEQTPFQDILSALESMPDLWMAFDDATLRSERFADLVGSPAANHPLLFKLPYDLCSKAVMGEFDLTQLPRLWVPIAEGAGSEDLVHLRRRGFVFAQGRRLPKQRRMRSDLDLELPIESPSPRTLSTYG